MEATEPAVDAPAEESEPVEVKGLDDRRRRGFTGFLASPWLAWTIALIAIGAAVYAGMQWADLYAADKARAQVRSDASDLAAHLTTFEGENIEEWFAQAKDRATGEYAKQLTQVFDQANRDRLRDAGVVSRGEVKSLFVQEVNGKEASVFAVVKQTYVNNSTNDPVEDELRMDITLRQVGGRWRGSEVAVLGPAGVVAPTGEAAPTEGDQ